MYEIEKDHWYKFKVIFEGDDLPSNTNELETWVYVEDGTESSAKEKCSERCENLWPYSFNKVELVQKGYYEEG